MGYLTRFAEVFAIIAVGVAVQCSLIVWPIKTR